jgi:hypothetical protein
MTYNTFYLTTNAVTTTQIPLKCAPQWTESEGRCYRVYRNNPLNWFEAESFCKRLAPGGHLASFSSILFQSNVTNAQYIYGNMQFWIGLNKLDGKEGGYKWVDGRPAQFFNWDQGQPSDFNGVEDCVEMRTSGKWGDRFCYSNKGWFCSIDKGVTPANVINTDVHNETFPSKFKNTFKSL